MPYLLFLKKSKILNCRLLQIIGGAFRDIFNGSKGNNLEKILHLMLANYEVNR